MAGFLGSNISMYICEGEEKRQLTPEMLRKSAFAEVIDADGRRTGWTGMGELLDTENFSLALVDARFGGFSFRIDERRPSQPVIRLLVEKKIREEEMRGNKVVGKRKKEIREEITETVKAQTQFAPALIDCIYDGQKGRLFVATTSQSRLELVLNLFKACSGMEMWPIAPERDMSPVFAAIQAAGGIEAEGFFLEPVGSASLASSPQSEEKSSIAVRNSPETVSDAVSQGMDIKKLTLLARENGTENEYTFTVGDDLVVRGLRLPKMEDAEGEEGLFLIHAEIVSQIADLVQSLSMEK